MKDSGITDTTSVVENWLTLLYVLHCSNSFKYGINDESEKLLQWTCLIAFHKIFDREAFCHQFQ